MTLEWGNLILIAAACCWMALVIYYALLGLEWASRSFGTTASGIRQRRRARRCASGHHDRTEVRPGVYDDWIFDPSHPDAVKLWTWGGQLPGMRHVERDCLYERCVDCKKSVRTFGPIRASPECHAPVKKRGAA